MQAYPIEFEEDGSELIIHATSERIQREDNQQEYQGIRYYETFGRSSEGNCYSCEKARHIAQKGEAGASGSHCLQQGRQAQEYIKRIHEIKLRKWNPTTPK